MVYYHRIVYAGIFNPGDRLIEPLPTDSFRMDRISQDTRLIQGHKFVHSSSYYGIVQSIHNCLIIMSRLFKLLRN